MNDLRLVIFDVDGTLVDSQGTILAAMDAAFHAERLTPPPHAATRGIVGLSLDKALARLAPGADAATRARLVEGYRAAYADLRAAKGSAASSPFFEGIKDVLTRLQAQPHTLLAVATGKSRRGMDHLIEGHGLHGVFQSVQTADSHPSKPHPAMIHACLAETGVTARRAVMVGDTTYDMQMARAAGVGALAVGWGYHAADALGAVSDHVAAFPGGLLTALEHMLEIADD